MSEMTSAGDQQPLTTTFNDAAAKNAEAGEAGPSVAETTNTNSDQAQPTESARAGVDQQPDIPGTGTPAGADIAPQFNQAAADRRLTTQFNDAAADQRLTPKFNEAAGRQDGNRGKSGSPERITTEPTPDEAGQSTTFPAAHSETIVSPAPDGGQATKNEVDDNDRGELAGDATNPESGDTQLSPEMHQALEEFAENKADVTTASVGRTNTPRKNNGPRP